METCPEGSSRVFLHNAGTTYGRAKQEVHHEPLDEAWVDIQTTAGSTQTLARISCGYSKGRGIFRSKPYWRIIRMRKTLLFALALIVVGCAEQTPSKSS